MATHYRVLYPFSAEARGELTVAANVRVELIAGEEHAGEGWCVAKRLDTEETGLLPMSYLATVDVATPAAPPAGATPPTTPGGSAAAPQPVPMETAPWSPAAPAPPGSYSPTTPPPPGSGGSPPAGFEGLAPEAVQLFRQAFGLDATLDDAQAASMRLGPALLQRQLAERARSEQQARIQVAQFEREFAERRDAAKREKELVAAEDARIRAIAREVWARPRATEAKQRLAEEREARAVVKEKARAQFGAARHNSARRLGANSLREFTDARPAPSQAKKVWEANEAERERLRKAREQEEIKVMARKAMAKPRAAQPKRKIARPKSAREAEEERVFQEAERLAKLDDDRRKVKTPGSKRAKASRDPTSPTSDTPHSPPSPGEDAGLEARQSGRVSRGRAHPSGLRTVRHQPRR